MTLILAVTTPHLVVLCADRRITTVTNGDRVHSQIDSDVKSFVLGSHSLAGFSGLATIDNLRFEHWLARELNSVPDETQLKVLVEGLTRARRKAANPTSVVLAVLGVGFRRINGQVRPQSWTISNAFDDDDEYAPEMADSRFRLVWKATAYGESAISTIGASVDPVLLELATTAIERCVAVSPTDPRPIFDNLETLNAAVASLSGGAVGTAIQLTAMSREAFALHAVGFTSLGLSGYDSRRVICDYRGQNVNSVDEAALHFPAPISAGASVAGILHSMNFDLTIVPADRHPQIGQNRN